MPAERWRAGRRKRLTPTRLDLAVNLARTARAPAPPPPPLFPVRRTCVRPPALPAGGDNLRCTRDPDAKTSATEWPPEVCRNSRNVNPLSGRNPLPDRKLSRLSEDVPRSATSFTCCASSPRMKTLTNTVYDGTKQQLYYSDRRCSSTALNQGIILSNLSFLIFLPYCISKKY